MVPTTTEPRVGRLVSLNVGLPKDVAWRRRSIRTGAWKRPVEGPLTVRRSSTSTARPGDLAGHGGEQRTVLGT